MYSEQKGTELVLFFIDTKMEKNMTVNKTNVQSTLKWGQAGVSLTMAILTIFNLVTEARNGNAIEDKRKR